VFSLFFFSSSIDLRSTNNLLSININLTLMESQRSWKIIGEDRKEELKEKPGTSQHWITPSLSGFHHTNLFDLRSVKGIDLYDN